MDSNNTAGSNVATRVSADTIPKEIMAVLPTDPNEQLEMSHRIANLAFSQKVCVLEAENNQLRQTLMQRQSQIKALERRVTNLELEVNDAQEKARHSMEEQTKLVGEKNALIGTVKKLNRDLAKLDSFKRNLLQSLQDEDETVPGGATMTPARDLSSDRLVNSVLSSSAALPPATPPRSYATPAAPTPGSTMNISTSSAAPPAPKALSPTFGASPAAGSDGSPRVDGKEFFRQARSRLAYEQFSQFLQNIKELNAHRQTREETLKKAQEIFGSENGDLYQSFESLLSRHLPL
ncbi:hypothetical protein CYMTET_21720 [Cymbomonas tetramitiformis]|uniref:At4g15545-like C-terminal domain-containing protein n=1 Tax=Cymbomonas tetramitiformis TaxID=36881 RepID=A0AAE0L303_9CHLO|nr:hypothetical protein CYMTET_21720 [Cymbomonas tetramitiformis]